MNPLEAAHDNAPLPTHIASDLRLVARENLRKLLMYLSDSPILSTHRGRGKIRHVLFYESIGITIDPEPPLDDNQMRAGWASFMRRARREFTRSAAELARTGRDWRTTFSEFEFAGLRAVPIDSKAALRYEGDRMRNCLAGYAEWCRIGMVQIVSFRDASTGNPVGDAAYERQPLSRGVTWRLIEAKEFANAQPSDRIRRLALACEDVLNVVDLAGPAKEVRRRLRSAG